MIAAQTLDGQLDAMYRGRWRSLLFPLDGKNPTAKWKDPAHDRYEQGDTLEFLEGQGVGLMVAHGLLVFDADSETASAWMASWLPEANEYPQSRSREGRNHYWVRLPDPDLFDDETQASILTPGGKVDLRLGGRGFVVAPPSINLSSGLPYQWIIPLPADPDDVPTIPAEKIAELFEMQRALKAHTRAAAAPQVATGHSLPTKLVDLVGTGEGARRNTAFAVGYAKACNGHTLSIQQLQAELWAHAQQFFSAGRDPFTRSECDMEGANAWARCRYDDGSLRTTDSKTGAVLVVTLEQAEPAPPAVEPSPVIVHDEPAPEGEFHDWEPLQDRAGPLFPVPQLPASMGEWVSGLAREMQVPADAVALWTLGIYSGCTVGRYELRVEGNWIEPANLYVVVSLESGARKSPTMKRIEGPVHEWQGEWNRSRQKDIERSGQRVRVAVKAEAAAEAALVKAGTGDPAAIAHAAEKLDERVAAFRDELHPIDVLVGGDITPEAMVTTLKRNGERLLISSAEGSEFFELLSRYGDAVNQDLALKAYSGDFHKVIRKGVSRVELDRPLLAVCLGVQPAVLEAVQSDPKFRSRGMVARFLYGVPNASVGFREIHRKPVSPAVEAGYRAAVDRTLDAPVAARTIDLSEEGHAELKRFEAVVEHDMRPGEPLHGYRDWGSKLVGQAARIALNLHCFETYHRGENPMERKVDAETVRQAVAVARWAMEHAEVAIGMSSPETVMALRVWRWACKRTTPFTVRELQRSLNVRGFKSADYRASLTVLDSRGYVRTEAGQAANGRSVELFYVNPAAREGGAG